MRRQRRRSNAWRRVGKVVLTGCAIALSALFSSLLVSWGAAPLAPVIAVVLGLTWAACCGDLRHLSFWATLAAVSGVGVLTSTTQAYHLLGGSATGITVREAAAVSGLSSFRFSDSSVLANYVGRQDVRTVRGASLLTISAAPLIHEGWTPDEPIAFWAVADSSSSRASAARWAQPYGAGVRLADTLEATYRQAVRQAAEAHQLMVAPDLIFIRWLPDPEAELTRARWNVGLIIAAAYVIWLFATALDDAIAQPMPTRTYRGRGL